MAHPHTLILAGALVVALGLVFAAAFAALRAAAAARRAVELAEASAKESERQQVARGETLEWLQDHVSRGIQILAKGCSSGEDSYQGGDDDSCSGDAGANPGNLH